MWCLPLLQVSPWFLLLVAGVVLTHWGGWRGCRCYHSDDRQLSVCGPVVVGASLSSA
jgi:hypothetical protein